MFQAKMIVAPATFAQAATYVLLALALWAMIH
jgi:hypothetical protein